MEKFTFYQPTRMVFGCGSLDDIGKMAKAYGKKCLLVTASNSEQVMRPLYDRVKKLLDKAEVTCLHFDQVRPNPDIRDIKKALEIVRREGIEVVLAVGGGSSIDTGKAAALFSGAEKLDWEQVFSNFTSPFAVYDPPGELLPLIAVPTTAGTGSELTQAMVISDEEKNSKECIFHQGAFPRMAVIDPELTKTLPRYLTAVTGFDAFTHAFESYIRECASPYTKMLSFEAMKTIYTVLPKLLKDLSNMEYREAMSRAAAFAGIALSNGAATIPHPLSEAVGGVAPFLPHGQCLASLYVAFLNLESRREQEKCAAVAKLLVPELSGSPEGEAAKRLSGIMEEFLKTLGLFKSYSELGVTETMLTEIETNPVFRFLPFASEAELHKIIRQSY